MPAWFWIIAGPNGAGKSTLANTFLPAFGHTDIIKLNADERTLALRKRDPAAPLNALNLRAAQEIDREVADCIEAGRTFLVETVLSSPKYRDDVERAKALGYKFGLIYVSLYPPELSPQRVSERAAKGGHNVEFAKAIERHRRSHDELKWFAPQADMLAVYDNSAGNGAPVRVAMRGYGEPFRYFVRGLNPALDEALAAAFPAAIKPSKPSAEPS